MLYVLFYNLCFPHSNVMSILSRCKTSLLRIIWYFIGMNIYGSFNQFTLLSAIYERVWVIHALAYCGYYYLLLLLLLLLLLKKTLISNLLYSPSRCILIPDCIPGIILNAWDD